MLINPVERFYTDDDRINLAHLRSRAERVLDELSVVNEETNRADKAGDSQLVGELRIRANELGARLADLDAAQYAVLNSIDTRYASSFKEDPARILDDVRAIVDATEKEEYLGYQKRRTAELKPLLEHVPADRKSREYRIYKRAKEYSVRGYQTCYQFILHRIAAQLKALAYYGAGDEEALAIVEAKAASYYNKPKGAKIPRGPIAQDLPAVKGAEVRGDLLNLPSGPVTTLIYDFLGGGDLGQLADRKSQFNRHIQLLVEEQGDKRRVSYTKDKVSVSLEIDDFRKVVNRNTQTKKILTRILLRANEQAIHNGELARDRVAFPLRELVGEGQYKNLDTARQGFYNAADTLTGLKVSGKIVQGKKKTIQQGVHAVLFKGAKVDNATCEVYLNDMLNWGLITPYYTGLPDYYFELPDRAAELLEYIFFLARQNTHKIAEQGYFTISYRAIQSRLNLPSEDAIRNTKRDIKDAIEGAIEAIEEKYSKYAPPTPAGSDPEFSLLPLGDYDAPIKKYLDEGKLQVTLKGDYAQRFIEISERTAAKLEAARKRQERIEDRARSINLAKSLEAEKKP